MTEEKYKIVYHTCPICQKVLSQYNITGHLKNEHNISKEQYEDEYLKVPKPFSCDICNKKFKSKKAVTSHKNNDHDILSDIQSERKRRDELRENSNIVCQICNQKFGANFSFQVHIDEKHPEISSYDYWKKYIDDGTETGTCKMCGTGLEFQSVNTPYNKFCSFSCSTTWAAQNTDRVEQAMDTIKKKKEIDPDFQLGPMHYKYWINKGFSVEEAQEKVKERQTTFTIEKCVEKYGKDGETIYNNRQVKWQQTLKNKPLEERIRIARSKLCKTGFSQISQQLFWGIYEKIKNYNLEIYFAQYKNKYIDVTGYNNEYPILLSTLNFAFLDFYIKDIKYCVEFDGEYWHGQKRANPEREKEREDLIKLAIPDIKIIHIPEKEYKKNKEKVINTIVSDIISILETKGIIKNDSTSGIVTA